MLGASGIKFHYSWQLETGTSKYVNCYKFTTPISASDLSMEKLYCTGRQVLSITDTVISSKLCDFYWTKVQMSMHEIITDAHPCTTPRSRLGGTGFSEVLARRWKVHAFCLSVVRIYKPRTMRV